MFFSECCTNVVIVFMNFAQISIWFRGLNILAKWYIIVDDNELMCLCFGFFVWVDLLNVILMLSVGRLISRLILLK